MKITKNPDYQQGNEERVKTKINKTMHNTEVANEIINKTDNVRLKETLIEKNSRRQDAVQKMKKEISP